MLGGSAGIGFETARLARDEGAEVILTARNPDRSSRSRRELGARHRGVRRHRLGGAAATSSTSFDGPSTTSCSPPAGPYYAPLPSSTPEEARRDLDSHLLLPSKIAAVAPTGRSGPAGASSSWAAPAAVARAPAGSRSIAALTAAMPALTKSLALELAPIRVNLIAPGFVDTPLSASILGERARARGASSSATTLPIGRVVGPADVAALAVHLMINTALTGATFDIDGGQQLT